MAGQSIIWKPSTGKGPVLLLNHDASSPPTITLDDGTVVTGKKAGTGGTSGVYNAEGAYQWVFPNTVLDKANATLSVEGQDQKLTTTNTSYRGDAVGSLSESSKGSIGDPSSIQNSAGGSGTFGKFTPGNIGAYGVAPANISADFPKVDTIPGAEANYQYVNPLTFAKQYTPAIRQQQNANFAQGGDQALSAINTELSGLKNYTATAVGLKQNVVASDNATNQAQRTQQVATAVPDVRNDLNNQAADARTYASGAAPDAVLNNAIGLNSRSNAAQATTAGGFGTGSIDSQKISDLMSAKDRISLSQYGEGLMSSNATARQTLNLAPTEYSNAGQQINAAPSISGSQLQETNASSINNLTSISASNAFANSTQQSQYMSNLDQQTQQFNATNTNNFALSFFNYLNSYTNSLAQAGQTNSNTAVEVQQQQDAKNASDKTANNTRHQNAIQSIMGATGSVAGLITSLA